MDRALPVNELPVASPTSQATSAIGDAQKNTTQLVPMGKVGRAYGLTGAVHVYPYSQDAQTLLKASTLLIGATTFAVTRSRRHGDAIVSQLVGIDSPEEAALLTNQEVFVDRALFAPLPQGEYYWLDLIGLTCTNGCRVFGEITEIFESGAHPILRVKQASGTDELIPFVDAIVRSVSLAERRVDVEWEGLD